VLTKFYSLRSYHRIAFYGKGWVASLSSRQFIIYSSSNDSTDEVILANLKKFAGSELLEDSNIPTADIIQSSDKKYIQITRVSPEVVDSNTFSFVRSLRDDAEVEEDSILTNWTEKTVCLSTSNYVPECDVREGMN
jgi:nitrogenase subunit NifH